MTCSKEGRFDSRIPELDGIRGVAILMVLCFHSFIIRQSDSSWVAHGWLTNFGSAIVSFGWSGVDLFFVLSGFLIGGILIDHRDAPNYFRAFYARRICRIFPLYFLWLAIYYFVQSFLGYSPFHWGTFRFPGWEYIFFVQNYYRTALNNFDILWMGHTWSLAIEEQFYLLLPMAMWFLRQRKLTGVLIIFILLIPWFRVFLFLFHPAFFIPFLLPCRADSLLIGVLCAYVMRQKAFRDRLAKNVKVLHAAVFLLSFGMVYLISLGFRYNPVQVKNSFEMTSYGYTLVALFYACLLLIAVVDRTSLIARLLRNRIFRHFGSIAYGIYIIHPALRDLMVEFISGGREMSVLSGNLISLPAFFTTWLLATLSWRFFEKPIVQWGHSFRYTSGKISLEADAKNPISSETPQSANKSE